MLTRVPEEIRLAEKAIDFGEFFSQEPLKFQFYYGENNQAEIINTIYLEDGNNPLTLYSDRGTSKLKSLCSIKYRHRLPKKISHIYHI